MVLNNIQPLIKNMYELLDSGNLLKLERIGERLVVRPAPQAIWLPEKPKSLWEKRDAFFKRNPSGGGKWQFRNSSMKEEFKILFHSYILKIKFTGFGHFGLFPEHISNFPWIVKQIQQSGKKLNILNLFAYTGLTTLSCARNDAFVTHLDSAKGVVDWAKQNAQASNVPVNNIRWIVDDVTKFIQKEIRRGKTYDAVILDPPSFGRGPKNELWKIEEHLSILLKDLKKLFSTDFKFLVLSGHSSFFTPKLLENILRDIFKDKGEYDAFEMLIPQKESLKVLPSGSCVRWRDS